MLESVKKDEKVIDTVKRVEISFLIITGENKSINFFIRYTESEDGKKIPYYIDINGSYEINALSDCDGKVFFKEDVAEVIYSIICCYYPDCDYNNIALYHINLFEEIMNSIIDFCKKENIVLNFLI